MDNYQSKAIISSIRATSRASVKINDNFFTIEYSEERTIPEVDGVDLDAERQLLWFDVNESVDMQIEDIVTTFGKKKNK